MDEKEESRKKKKKTKKKKKERKQRKMEEARRFNIKQKYGYLNSETGKWESTPAHVRFFELGAKYGQFLIERDTGITNVLVKRGDGTRYVRVNKTKDPNVVYVNGQWLLSDQPLHSETKCAVFFREAPDKSTWISIDPKTMLRSLSTPKPKPQPKAKPKPIEREREKPIATKPAKPKPKPKPVSGIFEKDIRVGSAAQIGSSVFGFSSLSPSLLEKGADGLFYPVPLQRLKKVCPSRKTHTQKPTTPSLLPVKGLQLTPTPAKSPKSPKSTKSPKSQKQSPVRYGTVPSQQVKTHPLYKKLVKKWDQKLQTIEKKFGSYAFDKYPSVRQAQDEAFEKWMDGEIGEEDNPPFKRFGEKLFDMLLTKEYRPLIQESINEYHNPHALAYYLTKTFVPLKLENIGFEVDPQWAEKAAKYAEVVEEEEEEDEEEIEEPTPPKQQSGFNLEDLIDLT